MPRHFTLPAALLASASAVAGPVVPSTTALQYSISDGNTNVVFNPTNVPVDEDGSFLWLANPVNTNTFTISSLNITGNVDPILGASFDLLNNTAGDVTYVIDITLPVAAVNPGTLNTGSAGLAITDTNGNGVTASDGSPASVFYTASIDGSPLASIDLLDSDLTAGNFLSNDTNGAFAQGGPAIATSIGLRYELTLSGGDRAAVSGVFVSQVPEPGSLALIAVGGALAIRRRRRG